MHYTITHKTAYTYFEPVSLCHNIIRLAPRNTDTQSCRSITVKIHPQPDTIDEYEDFFGNKVIYFSIEQEHRQLTVNVVSEVEKKPVAEQFRQAATMEVVKQELHALSPYSNSVGQYTFETAMTAWNEEIEVYAKQSFTPGRSVFEGALELTQRIYSDFEFKPGITTIATPLSVVMKERKGVCQDFAHVAIACIRSVGLPARYVSGYIETISPQGVEKLVGVDASHAWFSIYISGQGWVDFDPTNNQLSGDQHITIGWGRDYADIAPLKGVILSSGLHELGVSVDVRRSSVV
jgi:transglutaminase-like putative cysteine protease